MSICCHLGFLLPLESALVQTLLLLVLLEEFILSRFTFLLSFEEANLNLKYPLTQAGQVLFDQMSFLDSVK